MESRKLTKKEEKEVKKFVKLLVENYGDVLKKLAKE